MKSKDYRLVGPVVLRKFITGYGAPILVVCLICFVLYKDTISLFFWADDFIQLKLINDYSIAEYFRAGILGDLADDAVMKYLYIGSVFRPVTHYFYWKLSWLIFNTHPAGYHLTNLVIHISNSLLVFWLSALITRNKNAAFIASILYASAVYIHINPLIRLFIVNESLCVFFLLISLTLYILVATDKSARLAGKSWARLGLSVFSFGLALLSDERAIVTPVILVLYDLLFEYIPGTSIRALIKIKAKLWAPYWILSFIYLLIRSPRIIQAITSSGGRYEFQLRPDIPMKYYMGFRWTFMEYIRPIEILLEKSFPKGRFDRAEMGIILFVALIILIIFLLKFGGTTARNYSFRLIIFGICFFLLFPAPIMMAEPFGAQYFTMGAIGLCILVGYFIAQALEKVGNPKFRVAVLGIFLLVTALGALRLVRGYLDNPSGIPQRAILSRQLIELLDTKKVDVSQYDAIYLIGFPEKLFANSLFIIESAAFEVFLGHPATVYQGEEIENQPSSCQKVLIVDHKRGNSLRETVLPPGCEWDGSGLFKRQTRGWIPHVLLSKYRAI